METFIHYRKEGEYKVLSIGGFYTHEQAAQLMKEEAYTADDDRILLTYKKD